ncbi:MAG TPA: hypothetical protein PKA58_25245, partial [Polyangium sp.]|nr:hypothetical protein [Polyangium sp.]
IPRRTQCCDSSFCYGRAAEIGRVCRAFGKGGANIVARSDERNHAAGSTEFVTYAGQTRGGCIAERFAGIDIGKAKSDSTSC